MFGGGISLKVASFNNEFWVFISAILDFFPQRQTHHWYLPFLSVITSRLTSAGWGILKKENTMSGTLQKLWRSLLDDMYVLDVRNNSLQSSWCPSVSQIPLFLAMFPFPPSHFFCTSASILQSWDIWPDHHSVFSLFCPLEVLVKTSEFLLFFNHH